MPRFGSCCHSVDDPICITANIACEALIVTARVVLRAAEAAFNGAQHSVNVATVAFQAAQVTVNAARGSLDAANLVLETISEAYHVGIEVAGKIAELGTSGLVSIREISFEVSLGEANTGYFAATVKASFLRNADATIHLNINLRDITTIARGLADEIGDHFSSLF